MLTKFKGIIIFTKIYKENDLLIKFLSDTDEIISGIVYGGLSKKKRNILQIGHFLNFEVLYKLNRPASISGELTEPFVSNIVYDRYKLNCLMSVTSLINLSIVEGQKINNIYTITNQFLLKMFYSKKWFSYYCVFSFKLLQIIGYEIDYKNNNNIKYFDLEKLEFNNINSYSTIEFPHSLLNDDVIKLEFTKIDQFFKIFELVFSKYHLSNFNLSLPNQYHLFKKLILEKIK